MMKQCALKICSKEFELNKHNQKYCSRKCYKKAEYERNKETYKQYWNKEEVKKDTAKRVLKYYHQKKDAINAKRREEYKINPNPIKDKVNEYRLNNQDKIKKSKKKYEQRTKHIRNAKHQERYNNDELYKLRINLRTRLRNFLNDKGWHKDCHTSKLLGCTYEKFKDYLEKQFTTEMTWSNHGTYWHIDHRVPLAFAKNVEDLEKLCHYSNLQPLTIEENLSKGARVI